MRRTNRGSLRRRSKGFKDFKESLKAEQPKVNPAKQSIAKVNITNSNLVTTFKPKALNPNFSTLSKDEKVKMNIIVKSKDTEESGTGEGN
jgi:hypothetical protein